MGRADVTGHLAMSPGCAGTAAGPGSGPGRVRPAGLPDVLSASAERLLIGASVYREPADRNALLFQVGRHDWTAARAPGHQDPTPPYQEPADLGGMIAVCEAAGLLTVSFAAPGGQPGRSGPGPSGDAAAALVTVFADRLAAAELHRVLTAADRGHDLAAAHRRAAGYWRWRAAAWPQGHSGERHDLLEARYHLLEAGEIEQACELTGEVCSQLHAWGDLGQEAALISDTLTWLPEHCASSAALIHELGKIAQVRADYAEAERCYLQALDIFAAAGDRSGAARSHYSLGVLAQALGDYARAELEYQQSADAAPAAGPSPSPPAVAPVLPAATPPALAAVRALEPPAAASLELRRAAPAVIPAAAPEPLAAAAPGVPAATPGPPQANATPQSRSGTEPEPAGALAEPGHATARRLAALAAVAAALLALAAYELPDVLTSAGGTGVPATASASAVRQQAAAWVAGQISRSAIVSCDPAMCSDLQERGVPAGDLLVLGAAAPDPLGSDVVVATCALRNEFGKRLAGVYAPAVLASFGSGGARIEVRVIAPDGAAAYRAALTADLSARRQAGAQLLRNPRISVTAAARRQLSDGTVDSRLLITLATLAGQGQVRIMSFGEPAPGASTVVPLRSAVIAGPAAPDAAAGINSQVASRSTGQAGSAAYVPSVLAFLRAQRAPYLAAVIRAIRLPGGQLAVRIGFASPSPLGLLATTSPTG